MIKIQVLKPFRIAGVHHARGKTVAVSEVMARQLIAQGQAEAFTPEEREEKDPAPFPDNSEAPRKKGKK